MQVTRADIESSVTALGTLQPRRYVDVGAQASGQIRKIHVEAGDTVKEGQPLYRVYAAYSSDLEFARQASERNAGYYLGEAGAETRQFVEF